MHSTTKHYLEWYLIFSFLNLIKGLQMFALCLRARNAPDWLIHVPPIVLLCKNWFLFEEYILKYVVTDCLCLWLLSKIYPYLVSRQLYNTLVMSCTEKNKQKKHGVMSFILFPPVTNTDQIVFRKFDFFVILRMYMHKDLTNLTQILQLSSCLTLLLYSYPWNK